MLETKSKIDIAAWLCIIYILRYTGDFFDGSERTHPHKQINISRVARQTIKLVWGAFTLACIYIFRMATEVVNFDKSEDENTDCHIGFLSKFLIFNFSSHYFVRCFAPLCLVGHCFPLWCPFLYSREFKKKGWHDSKRTQEAKTIYVIGFQWWHYCDSNAAKENVVCFGMFIVSIGSWIDSNLIIRNMKFMQRRQYEK